MIDPCGMQGRLIETKGIEGHVHIGIAAPRFQINHLQCPNLDSMDSALRMQRRNDLKTFQANAWEGSLTFPRIWWETCRKSLGLEVNPMVSHIFSSTKTKESIEHPPVHPVPVACASTIQLQKQLKIAMEFCSSRTIPARTPVTRRKGWATPTIKLPRMIVPKWYPGSQSAFGISTNWSILNHGYLWKI